MKSYLYILIAIFFCIPFTIDAENLQGQEPNNKLERVDIGYAIQYRKLEPSGCSSEVTFRNNSSTVSFSYGDYFCRKAADYKLETIPEIGKSISEIISHFQLEDEIRTKKHLYLGVGIEHLIRYMNNDESWPKDIYAYADSKYSDEYEKVYFIYEVVGEEILKSKIYDPFISILNKMGCKIVLPKVFADGVCCKKYSLTKKDLMNSGFLKNDGINKERYPGFKSTLTFDLTCDGNQ